jgi:hypothetical protein
VGWSIMSIQTWWLHFSNSQLPKWQWMFSFLRRCFLSSITDKHFTGMRCVFVFVFCVLHPMVSVSFVFAPVLNSGVALNVYPIMCCSPCYGVRYDFRIKSIFGSSFSSAVCRTAYVLCYLCLIEYSGVQHVLTMWVKRWVYYKRLELLTLS